MSKVEQARQVAAAFWGSSPGEVFAEDISSEHAWAVPTAVIQVMDLQRRRLLVALSPDGQAHVLGQSDRLDRLNQLFRGGQVALPKGLPPLQLAASIRALLEGPGGFVASMQLFAREENEIGMWTARSPSHGPQVFQEYCRDPVLRESGGSWELEFFFYNNLGGVESWWVQGDANGIRQQRKSVAVPDGSFNFPYG